MVVLLLVAMVACTATFLLPLRVSNAVALQAEAVGDILFRMRPVVRVGLGVLLALTANLIFLLFLILEVRRPATKAIKVQQTTGGEVELSVESIADRVDYEVDQLPGVLNVSTDVTSKRGGVLVELDVNIAGKLDVPKRAEQIVETARQVVEDKMGLKLARPPKVHLRAVSRPEVRRQPVRSPGIERMSEPTSESASDSASEPASGLDLEPEPDAEE
jgi:hypothetical protein